MIVYRVGNDLELDRIIDLYASCTLGPRRPLSDRERMAEIIRGSNLVITAWDDDLPVGIARSLSDFAYVTYLADLAIRESHQRRGIGKELIRRTQQAAPRAQIVLLSAPQAVDYYPRIGLERHNSAWVLNPGQSLA